MKRRSVVLWDVGGTLVDYAVSMKGFLSHCLEPVNIKVESLNPSNIADPDAFRRSHEDSWRTLDDENADHLELATILLRGTSFSMAQVQQVAYLSRKYYDLYAPVPGVRSLLDELADLGVPQGVVSNWPPSLREFLQHHGLGGYFTVIVGSGEVGIAKPDPAIFARALEQMRVTVDDCIYVGDNPEKDIQPAKQLGMHAVHFNPRKNYADSDAKDIQSLRQVLLPLLSSRDKTCC